MKRVIIKNPAPIGLLLWRIGANSHAAMTYYDTAFYKWVDGDFEGAMDLIERGNKRERIVTHNLMKLRKILRRAQDVSTPND